MEDNPQHSMALPTTGTPVYTIEQETFHVVPGYFLSFEAFVLFAQAPDEGNKKLTGIYSEHTWVCVMVKLILL